MRRLSLRRWLAVLSLGFVALTAPFLGRYPLISGDDALILAVGHKWAASGVFGSDLFAGFHGADRHYFMNFPLHHVWQTAVFTRFGSGFAQARAVALAFAVLLLWPVGWLADRWYGRAAGLLAPLLLVAWRSGLTGPGIPLLLVGRTARYDAGAVFWSWLAVALLLVLLRRRSAWLALAVGLCGGFAALTQFFGLFSLPLIAWLWLRGETRAGRRPWRDPLTYALAAGGLLPLLPYAWYAAQHWADAIAQLSVHGGRADFGSPAFFWHNLRAEPRRYAGLLRPPGTDADGYHALSGWLLLLGAPAVLWHTVRRWRRERGQGDAVLLASLVVFGGGLALLEGTKAPLYAVILLPAVCILFARAGVEWLRGGRRQTAVGLLLAAVVLAEGGLTYAVNLRRAVQATPYAVAGQQLRAALPRDLPPETAVVAFERWWWALQPEHPVLIWYNLWEQWRVAQARPAPPTLPELVSDTPAGVLVVSPVDWSAVQRYPPRLQAEFGHLLRACAAEIGRVADPAYGELTLYRLNRAPDGGLRCAGRNPWFVIRDP
ncbi:MAG: hypothetical protein KC425_19715 [Anaerolineales bacterium]|nr:hypothetical protein [Anaerolineales bacterium]